MTFLRLGKLLSLPPSRAAALAYALGACALGACTDKPPKSLGLDVAFACESVRSEAASLHVDIHRDDCDGELVRSFDVVKGETPKADSALDPGSYGLVGQALDENGRELGRGCVVASLPATTTPRLVVSSAACEDAGAQLDSGGPDTGVQPTPTPDAQLPPADGSSPDAQMEDAGPDADAGPPPVCPASCADPDPCTDDRCENGVCVHVPFSGARECDGIACTSGDTCVAGTCTAGAPTDGLCAQPGDACRKASCVAGLGCNVTNDEGAQCNDGIACTSGDVCRAGVCRGADSCSSGKICVPSTGQCISQCSGPSDCDDANPCTNDLCTTGTCTHSPNTGAACNDGNACTSPPGPNTDQCVNGVCTGASTCGQGAVCVGSACQCPADTSQCGNACANLLSSQNNCGVCERACGSTQTCQGGACKPTSSDASSCTSARYGGHDYLFCTDTQNWGTARNKCASWGFGLAIIGDANENSFVRSGIGARPAWIGANDSSNGSQCRLAPGATGEGHWFWASATDSSLTGTPLCDVTASGVVNCAPIGDAYTHWASGQPDNSGCTCAFFCTFESADCGLLQADGNWDDDRCSVKYAYICESP